MAMRSGSVHLLLRLHIELSRTRGEVVVGQVGVRKPLLAGWQGLESTRGHAGEHELHNVCVRAGGVVAVGVQDLVGNAGCLHALVLGQRVLGLALHEWQSIGALRQQWCDAGGKGLEKCGGVGVRCVQAVLLEASSQEPMCLKEEVAAGRIGCMQEGEAVSQALARSFEALRRADAGEALWAGGIQAGEGAGVKDVEAVRAVHWRCGKAAFAGQSLGERAVLATEEFAEGTLWRQALERQAAEAGPRAAQAERGL
ncbi:unnamed protein product [Symbiodinium sp. CCMP2456]|nr:unnamed protein product [Symbiodinium sp. CCMP2456]